MIQHPLQEVGVQRMEHVKEVFPRRPFILGKVIGKVSSEQIVVLELRLELLHRELVVVGHMYVAHVCLLNEGLLVRENLLEEVFVDRGLVRQVVLQTKVG